MPHFHSLLLLRTSYAASTISACTLAFNDICPSQGFVDFSLNRRLCRVTAIGGPHLICNGISEGDSCLGSRVSTKLHILVKLSFLWLKIRLLLLRGLQPLFTWQKLSHLRLPVRRCANMASSMFLIVQAACRGALVQPFCAYRWPRTSTSSRQANGHR